MWEKRRGFTSHARVLAAVEPVSQWTIPEKNGGNREGGGLRTNFFENPLGFLGFCFNPANSKQNKASPKEIPQNCYTPQKF